MSGAWSELADAFRRDARISELSTQARWQLAALAFGALALTALVLAALS